VKETLIIAEAGVNHNGSLELALQLVDAAKAAGADIIKFQAFIADNLVTQNADQAQYQQNNIGKKQTQLEMLKELELSFDSHQIIKNYCEEQGIEYLSTAFDMESLNFLTHDMQLNRFKIPSGEITNAPFILAHACTGKELIVSTGMSDLVEVKLALAVIAFGLLNSIGQYLDKEPNEDNFYKAFNSVQGQKQLKEKVTLLHCTTDYPARPTDINLLALKTMEEAFSLRVGYSDHSEGISVPIAAVARGACIIEKHFTLNKLLPGPDHKASLSPEELNDMVKSIRLVEQSIGNGIKQATPAELNNKKVIRKSLVAGKNISKGECFTKENLVIKRPGTGLSPLLYWEMLNHVSKVDYQAGDLIKEHD